MIRSLIALLSLAFLAVATAGAQAAPYALDMRTGGPAGQPKGHYQYCQDYFPQNCQARHDPGAQPLTQQRWEQLVSVKARVDSLIHPMDEWKIWPGLAKQRGVKEAELDNWTGPVKRNGLYVGDCDDYVLAYQAMLIKRGWHPSDLLITAVRQSDGTGHLILSVRVLTSSGEPGYYVLDNLQAGVHSWQVAGHHFLKRQSPRHGGKWETINHKVNPGFYVTASTH